MAMGKGLHFHRCVRPRAPTVCSGSGGWVLPHSRVQRVGMPHICGMWGDGPELFQWDLGHGIPIPQWYLGDGAASHQWDFGGIWGMDVPYFSVILIPWGILGLGMRRLPAPSSIFFKVFLGATLRFLSGGGWVPPSTATCRAAPTAPLPLPTPQVNGMDTVRVPMDVVEFMRPRTKRRRHWQAQQAALLAARRDEVL